MGENWAYCVVGSLTPNRDHKLRRVDRHACEMTWHGHRWTRYTQPIIGTSIKRRYRGCLVAAELRASTHYERYVGKVRVLRPHSNKHRVYAETRAVTQHTYGAYYSASYSERAALSDTFGSWSVIDLEFLMSIPIERYGLMLVALSLAKVCSQSGWTVGYSEGKRSELASGEAHM